MEIESQETADKNKFALRSSFKKPKHKTFDTTSVEKPTDNSAEQGSVAPKKELVSIYSHRNEDNMLIKHRSGKRSVTFSNEPVQIELAAPRTFTRNYIKANTKKKKDITSEGLYMLMKNPEVLQRLDNADGSTKPLVKPADQSTPGSDLGLKINVHDQIKISYYKPPNAGSWAPPASTKDGSDGESNSSGESSEENVYVVGQSEHDEECLNILSNGLDEDEENDSFFNNSNPLKETNIDDVIFSAKMTEVIENSSPRKFKETSLIETPPATVEESEESEESSLGSVDSGIHEAGTDHDSPIEEALPPLPQKPPIPTKPMTTVTEPSKAPAAIPEPAKAAPQIKPKPRVVPKPQPQVVELPKPPSQAVAQPKPPSQAVAQPKPPSQVVAQPKPLQPVVAQPKPLQQVLPQPKPPQQTAQDESEGSEETESESEESETSSLSSNDRPPSPVGHEMTYLQYDEEPMLPKYKKDQQIEKKRESLTLEQIPVNLSPNRDRRSPLANDIFFRGTEFIPDSRPKVPTPDIPKTSLENFFSPTSQPVTAVQVDGPGRDRRNSELMERHEMEQKQLREIQRLKHIEEQRLRELQIQQQIEQQKLSEIQAQQHIQRQMEIKRQQELQLQIERQQLEELQRHRELQQIQEMQRLELMKIQEEEMRREIEAERQKLLADAQKRQIEEQQQQEFELQLERERLRVEQERQMRLEKQKQEDQEKLRQLELLQQIDAERQRQFEAERERQMEAEKMKNANTPQIQQNAQLNADFEDIDSLLEGLMELDPIIHQQSQQHRLQQLESEVRRSKQREEEERRQWELEQARVLQEENARKEQDRLENELVSAEEAKRKKQTELEATRERKRKMREMSLDDVLKLQKSKKKGSPTPSVRSETIAFASLKRHSSESLNSVAASLDRGNAVSRNPGGNQMIAPISLLHEIINPYTRTVQEEEPIVSCRMLPVIVDSQLVPSPTLPPRTDLEKRQQLDVSSLSSSSTASNRVEPEFSAPLDLTAIKTKLEPQPQPLAPPKQGGRDCSPNSLVEPYIVTAKIEKYGGPQQLAPPLKPPNTALSPNTVRAKQQEQWLDIDDLLADVQSMITDDRSTQPAVPPRIVTPSSQSLQLSPHSTNTSTSSYNEVFESSYPPPVPPKVPSRSNSPNAAQQPPLPVRSFTSGTSTPPVSPRDTPPRSPAVVSLNTPPRSPPVPSRVNLSDLGRSNSERCNNSEPVFIPRANSEGSQFKRSAFQNFQPTPNPHEDSVRRKSSIDDLNKRTQQLSLQRNQSYTGSFRSPGASYPLSPQPQEYLPPTNVTVPFYQPQKMYQRQSPPSNQRTDYANVPPQGYGYTSPPPPQYASPPPAQFGSPPPLPPYTSPPINQVYPQNRNASPPPPPLPRRHNKINNSKHHTTV